MKHLKTLILFGFLSSASLAQATIVEFQTSLGNFEVNLFDEYTPETVENFLTYVRDNAYENTFIHRSVTGFVVQGGGFTYVPPNLASRQPIAARAPVVNEPFLSNQRGTIAMAKLEGNPNSATNQWFFSLRDNSANLDAQNGGFTAFGQISEEGLAIIDAIGALSRFNAGGALNQLPLRNYTTADANNQVPVTDEHLVIIQNIVIIDERVDTAADLNPMLTTNPPSPRKKKKFGSLDWVTLSLLALLAVPALLRRRRFSI